VAIELTCPCGKKLQVKEEFAGRMGVCPGCGQALDIPGGATIAPPPLPVFAPELSIQPPPLPQVAPPAVPRAPERARASSIPPEEQPDDAELRNHGGGAFLANADFFVDPPAEIGHLSSAHTTLTKEKEAWSLSGRMVLSLASTGIGVLIGC
jgi:hypothetical protein